MIPFYHISSQDDEKNVDIKLFKQKQGRNLVNPVLDAHRHTLRKNVLTLIINDFYP